jgi:hypothetical protein
MRMNAQQQNAVLGPGFRCAVSKSSADTLAQTRR